MPFGTALCTRMKSAIYCFRYFKEDETLVLIIEDDGVGREASLAMKSGDVRKGKSLGMGITSDRLKYFSERSEVEVEDLTSEEGVAKGTRVIIRIPFS